MSTRSISDVRAALRAALSQAIKEELISRNVAMNITLPKRRRPTRRRQAWTTDEARAFLESARHDDRHYAAYVLILVLGLHKGEVLGLTWDDIDLDTATLNIERQLQRVGRQLLHRETKTESSDAEGLPLPDICTTALRLRRDRQQRDKATAGPRLARRQTRVHHPLRHPIEPRNLNRAWDLRCAKAGIRKITIHDGRRSCGTLLADLDVHPRVAMQILRHTQFSLTMEIYTLASSKATRDALKRLGQSLDGTP